MKLLDIIEIQNKIKENLNIWEIKNNGLLCKDNDFTLLIESLDKLSEESIFILKELIK